MNSCHDIELLLAEYAAGDLSEDTARRVADHLTGCEACRRELTLETRLRGQLTDLPVVPTSAATAGALQQIPSTLSPSPQPRRRRSRSWLPVASLVAAAAVLLLILMPTVGTHQEPEPVGAGTDLAAAIDQPTPEQIAAVRRDALWTLAKTARIIDKSERATISDVFGRRLPRTINGSLRQALANTQGGQG